MGLLNSWRSSSQSNGILWERHICLPSLAQRESTVCMGQKKKKSKWSHCCGADATRLSVRRQSLWGALSDTEGFNFFPPPSICIFLHLRGPPRCCSPHSAITLPFAQYIWITGNEITAAAPLQAALPLIVSAQALTTLSFLVSSGGVAGLQRVL